MWERAVGDQLGIARHDGLNGDTLDRLDEPYIWLAVDSDDHLTPTQARRLAADLIEAADLAER